MKSEIIFPVPELKAALSGLNKLVGRKATLPVLSCVRVSRQKNGQVTLQATDLNAHATFTLVNTQPGDIVDVLVPLEQLNKAFKCNAGAKQDMSVVSEGNSSKLRYSIGGNPVEQPFTPLPLNEWPPVPRITTQSTELTPGFGEALKQALACCNENHARVVLQGACLDASDTKSHYIVGGNGHMLYAANSFTFPLKGTVIIPNSRFLASSGLLDMEPCYLAVQPGKKPSDTKYVCLQNKQWQFVTREIDGQFPNWKHNLPAIDGKWTLAQLRPPAVQDLLKVIPNLPGADDANSAIRLRLDKVLWVEGKNKDDADWTKIAVQDVAITGKPKEICVNREYLLQALQFGLDELAVLQEFSPMVCRKEGKQMVIMPLNLKAPQTTKPSVPQPTPASEPEQEERKTDMPRTSTKPTETPQPAQTSASLIDQVEQIKETLKNVVRDLSGLVDAVKQAEKDKRASEKEVETARTVLKKLQQVSI